ncbi:MAG: ATPase [Propionibacteriaceae bacterium]|jgi:N-acetylglucosamine kinase-like BadF-type ATPase|nr:ATPase [Propionibacteriaceae bacterium]
MTPVVVAVDGGGTKTDVAVLGLDGRLLARRRFGSFMPQTIGPVVATGELDRAVAQVMEPLGQVDVVAAGLYFSGLDFPFETEQFRDEVVKCRWAGGRLLIDNDTFALMRLGSTSVPAVAVVCGTGMNCVGAGSDGRLVRFAAVGEVSGDWGGGASLGLTAIWYAARAADGRGSATMLEDLVLAHLGRSSMAEVILGFHVADIHPEVVPGLAPLVFQAAHLGDPLARTIVAHQAEEIVTCAVAAIERLDAVDIPCPVVLGGGVIAAGDRSLLEGIRDGLARRAPSANIVVVSRPPITGAALLVFDDLGGDSATIDQVKRTFSD